MSTANDQPSRVVFLGGPPPIAEWLGMDAAEEAGMELAVRLAKAIRRRREEAGLTQDEFAAKIGRSQSAIAKAECGQVSLGRLVGIHLAAGGTIEVGRADREAVGRQVVAGELPRV